MIELVVEAVGDTAVGAGSSMIVDGKEEESDGVFTSCAGRD